MFKRILLIFSLWSWTANAQWTDDFSDGEFTSTPPWSGDTADFRVNPSGQLQLNAIDPGISTLGFQLPLAALSGTEWTFTIRLDFSPSSSNHARVYLVSDLPDFSGNGYFLQFGEALSNDAVELFRQDGSNLVSVCRGPNGQIAGPFTIGVKVVRDVFGVWTLSIDSTGGTDYVQVALGAEAMYDQSAWTGIRCTYTSSNATKFYFDDFYVGPVRIDTTPPQVLQSGAVVINEVCFEPSAASGIPNAEFVELYNRLPDAVKTDGWVLSDGSGSGRFSSHKIIPGNGYAVVCAMDDTSLFTGAGNVIGVAGFPGLNNDVGDRLRLTDRNGVLLSELVFSDEEYHDPSKDDGGWTIERIDDDFLCTDTYNWKASDNPSGGTPGFVNAVAGLHADVEAPSIAFGWMNDTTHVMIRFTEPLDSFSMIDPLAYEIRSETNQQVVPNSVIRVDERTVELTVPGLPANEWYEVRPQTMLRDCPGNAADTNHRVRIALGRPPQQGEIMINEILFNPYDGGSDFIEVVNPGLDVIDLYEVNVAETSVADSFPVGSKATLTEEHLLLFPSEVLAFSRNITQLKQRYLSGDKRRTFRCPTLPDFNAVEGGVLLTDPSGSTLCWSPYREIWHYPLLMDAKGVSLERLSITGNGSDPGTWHSAAGTSGFATPGKKNSQSIQNEIGSGEVELQPVVFTPDNDGEKDVLTVSYRFPDPGRLSTLRIFSESGGEVRYLANNELSGSEGSFQWDGTDDSNRLVPAGRYVIFMETISMSGSVRRYVRGCGVVY